MKFFDYKFLILLGLTLVVYFIYREVEFLRSKVNKIETELNQKKLTTESIPVAPKMLESVTKPVLQLPSIKNNIQSKSPEKVINLDLVSQSLQLPKQLPLNKSFSPKELYTSSSDDDEQLDTSSDDQNENTSTEIESESSKHLAIYSNDNEQFDSAQNSLIDSVEANKLNMDNVDLKSTMDNIINDLSSESEESNKSKQQEIDEIIMEKEKQLSEMSPKSDQQKEKQLPDMSPKSNKQNIKEAELNELKLADLKNMASKLGITFSRKINGVQKTKTKQELIQDILQNN
jgi:hypothetical protein